MKHQEKLAITSRSFAKNPILRKKVLDQYENVTFNDDGILLKGDALIDFLKDHQMAIVSLDPIDDNVLKRVPTLKTISKYGVGLNSLDFSALEKNQVKLGWTGGVNKRSVTELAITLMLSCLRNTTFLNQDLQSGNFTQKKGRCLTGKTIGLIGFGNIGKDIAKILQAFDCKILCHDLFLDKDYCAQNQIESVDLNTLLQNSDIISIHLPLTESTKNFIDQDEFKLMKDNAILINTARGGLVNENALFAHLKASPNAQAGFDVFEQEPPQNLELIKLSNFIGLPHIGGSTEEAIMNMGFTSIDNLQKALPISEFKKINRIS